MKQLNLKHLITNNSQLELLDDLSRLLVPLQSIPDLAEHTALPFILNMVDKVYESEDREIFAQGYAGFDKEVKELRALVK